MEYWRAAWVCLPTQGFSVLQQCAISAAVLPKVGGNLMMYDADSLLGRLHMLPDPRRGYP